MVTAVAAPAPLNKCEHPNAEVFPPCCDGKACGCYGMFTVFCPDCEATQIPDSEMDRLINDFIRDEREEC